MSLASRRWGPTSRKGRCCPNDPIPPSVSQVAYDTERTGGKSKCRRGQPRGRDLRRGETMEPSQPRRRGQHLDVYACGIDRSDTAGMSPPKRSVVRFAVGSSTGPRSGVWRLWTSIAGRSDVYIAARTLGGVVKVGLHESGEWHHAFTTEYANRNLLSCPLTVTGLSKGGCVRPSSSPASRWPS